MCQSVQLWCIGCRKIRPGLQIQTCEKYDAATNSCVDLKLENPPLRPHFQYCDNLQCKYLDPALAWHPDRPLSPESQVFADRLKDAVKFATALEAARAQADKKVDALGDSENLEAQASKSTTDDTSGNAEVSSVVRSVQLLASPSSVASRPQTTTSSMHAATVPESVSHTENGHSICPEERSTQQSSSRRLQAGAALPQSATSRGVVQKPVHAAPSPLPSQGIRQGIISTRATPDPSKLAGTPKPSSHLSQPGHPASTYGSPSNIFQQAHARCIVPQLGGPVTPSSIEQRGTGSYATPVNGGLRAPPGMRPTHNQQRVLNMPLINPQPSTSPARARQAMNPGHRAIMDKLLNPNAVLPSRSSRSPSVQHVQHSRQTPKLSATLTPLQSQPAPPARTPQSSTVGIIGMSSEVSDFVKSLEAQVYELRRDHYQPTPLSIGSDYGTMNSGTMINRAMNNVRMASATRNNRNLMYQDQDVFPGTNSQQGNPNKYSPFQAALLHQRYTNYPQGHGGGLVGFDAYHAGGQQVSATYSNPWSNPWASAGSQFSQIGQGYPQQQNMNMNPSLQMGAMPMPNSNGTKRSHSEASNDGMSWENIPYFAMPTTMDQQRSHSTATHQPGLAGYTSGYERPLKRVRVSMQNGPSRPTQSPANGQSNGVVVTTPLVRTATPISTPGYYHTASSIQRTAPQVPVQATTQPYFNQPTNNALGVFGMTQPSESSGFDFGNPAVSSQRPVLDNAPSGGTDDWNLAPVEDWDSIQNQYRDDGFYSARLG